MTTLKLSLEVQHGTTARYRRGCRCPDCRHAVAEYTARYREDHPRHQQQRRVPFAPLDELLNSRGLSWHSFGWISGPQLKKWRESDVPLLTADALCARLGLHISEVYGPDWNDL